VVATQMLITFNEFTFEPFSIVYIYIISKFRAFVKKKAT